MAEEKKFTEEQVKKARDIKRTFAEIYVEPKGMRDNPIPKEKSST